MFSSMLGDGLLGGYSYFKKVLGYDPIGYWPLWESSGLIAESLVGSPGKDGAYSSGVSTWPTATGIGDGRTAPDLDGTNDYVNIYSVPFRDDFNGSEGTAIIWMRLLAAAWTDGAIRYALTLHANASNHVYLWKGLANNTFNWNYRAGGTLESVQNAAMNQTVNINVGITWSASLDEVRAYINGIQTGATQNGLGAWGGAATLSPTDTVIGARSTAPANLQDGVCAHAVVFDQALTPAQMALLGVL